MTKKFKIILNTNRKTDPDYDAILLPFEGSDKVCYYFSNPNLYDVELLPNNLYFDANFFHIPKFDFPFTNSGIFIVSKKVKEVFEKFIEFKFNVVPVIMFDDTCLKDRFLNNLELNNSIPTNEDYLALRLPKLDSYFDFENSVYRVPKYSSKGVRGIKKLVLKEPKEGFPAIFRTKEKSTIIFVREDLRRALEANNFKGCVFEEVETTAAARQL